MLFHRAKPVFATSQCLHVPVHHDKALLVEPTSEGKRVGLLECSLIIQK